MYRIAIIGPTTCIEKTKNVKDFLFKVKQTFGDTATIISGGNLEGIEFDVKKYALQFGLSYKEFNPSFTGYNEHSALYESYYGKKFHSSHYRHRYDEMLKRIDRLVIGIDPKSNHKLYFDVQKKSEKKGIKTVFL